MIPKLNHFPQNNQNKNNNDRPTDPKGSTSTVVNYPTTTTHPTCNNKKYADQ